MRFPFNLAQRDRRPERMDDPTLPAAELTAALRGIERLNRWSNSAQILWTPLSTLLRANVGRTVRALDVGAGSGDLPIALWRRARRAGCDLQIDGCDVSETAINLARARAAAAGAPSRFMQSDAVDGDIPDGYDAIMCSLFLHHLADDEAEGLLRRMARAARGLVLVNDLVRSRAGLVLAYAATMAASRSAVVHYDGPVSVRGAFTVAELGAMAAAAGLSGARVERRWPCRMLLSWWRS